MKRIMRDPESTTNHLTCDPDILAARRRKANATRTQRALMKRALKAGTLKASTVVLKMPWWAQKMKAYQLLVCTPYVGIPAADAALEDLRISDSKNLGMMTERQTRDLTAFLERLEQLEAQDPAPD